MKTQLGGQQFFTLQEKLAKTDDKSTIAGKMS